MRLGISGQMAVAGGLVAAAVAVAFGFLFAAVHDLRASSRDAQQSQELLVAANTLQVLVVQLQSSQRGYLIADDRDFLQSYDRAASRLEGATARVERLARLEPARLPLVRRLARQVRAYYDEWSSPLLRLAARDVEAARSRVVSGEGERRSRRIASLFDALAAGERLRAEEAAAAADRAGRNAVWIGVAAAATILVFLALIVGYFTVGVVAPVKRLAAAARRATAGDLASRVEVTGLGEARELGVRFNEMMSASEREARTLERRRAELSAVLDAAAEGIAMTGMDGELIFTNERMDQLWSRMGVAEKGTIWERLAGLAELTGVGESYAPAFLQLAADPEAVLEDDFDVPSLQRSFRGYTAPVRGPYGFVIGRLFSLRETTRERAAEQAKDEFLATVSHELRTPLTAIRGYLEVVLDGETGELTSEQRRFLGIVDRSASHLTSLVEDLLVVGRTAEGRLDLDLAEVDLAEIAAGCVEAAAAAAGEKRIRLSLDAEPGAVLRGDRLRLTQLVTNLVGNAIKFTPDGGHVDVRAGPAGELAVLEVADDGIGIAEEEQERVFERFFRASGAAEGQVPGTGLGLAITKAIVEAHDGKIDVRSSRGEGTTFRVELPREDGR